METALPDENLAVGDHRDLLDIIDSFRSQGVSRYVDLPEIIVCGDQSAGKSSVLEAISGMPFPTKDGLCTRFATELILRRGSEVKIKVSITPGESRFGEDRERLESWQPKASIDKEGLGAVTDEAKRAMTEATGAGEFFDDILRIELNGPEQPHLTMVDLPGLFRRGNKEQSDADVGIVRGMVKRYMGRPRSIILTVVSAKYEYVLQEVTLMAKHADPDGLRTLGLITKPDTLDVGSDSESFFVRLAQNNEETLRLGWHVMKNRNFEERHVTSAKRDANGLLQQKHRLAEFGTEMRLSGQSQHIIDSESEGEGGRVVRDLPCISRSDYIEDVAKRLKFSKGRELQGLFNPLIVGDLFVEQREPWRRIAKVLAEDILEATHSTTQLVVQQIAASDVAEGILKLLRQAIEGLKVEMDAKVDALLASATQHPITYNPQFTDNVQRAQQARYKRAVKKLVRKAYGSVRFDDPDSTLSINPMGFLDLMGEGFERDMERFGSALAVDYMEAYYKVAVSRFIDDVSVLAIEDCLIGKLETLFGSSRVMNMSESEVTRLAGETPESSQERERLEAKQRTLETGLQGLKMLNSRRRNVSSAPDLHQEASEDAEQTPTATTPSRSERAPTTASRAESPGEFSCVPVMAAAPEPPPPADPWEVSRAETRGKLEDEEWDFPPPSKDKKKKKKGVRSLVFEEAPFPEEPEGIDEHYLQHRAMLD